MTRKEKREMDRLHALVAEANVQRDRAWEAYTQMLYRVVDAEARLKRIKEEIEDG